MRSSTATTPTDDRYDFRANRKVEKQLELLDMKDNHFRHGVTLEETRNTPLFSEEFGELSRRQSPGHKYLFSQYGLLAGRISEDEAEDRVDGGPNYQKPDPRIFLNVTAPWSAFICGSQGSGKSHSLSCMIENCLVTDDVLGSLPNPLAGMVFHYDPLGSTAGQVCEAVYLCSPCVHVKVLVSPTSFTRMKNLYQNVKGLRPGCVLTVEPLILKHEYLNVERLKTFMASDAGALYMQSVLRVLREMASDPGAKPGIDYEKFKTKIETLGLTPGQKGPLSLRLDLLEDFIEDTVKGNEKFTRKIPKKGNDWAPSGGRLIIVDLSCQFLDVNTACTLFDIYLGVFLEQKPSIGRLVALDEAHKVIYSHRLYFLRFKSFSTISSIC